MEDLENITMEDVREANRTRDAFNQFVSIKHLREYIKRCDSRW